MGRLAQMSSLHLKGGALSPMEALKGRLVKLTESYRTLENSLFINLPAFFFYPLYKKEEEKEHPTSG